MGERQERTESERAGNRVGEQTREPRDRDERSQQRGMGRGAAGSPKQPHGRRREIGQQHSEEKWQRGRLAGSERRGGGSQPVSRTAGGGRQTARLIDCSASAAVCCLGRARLGCGAGDEEGQVQQQQAGRQQAEAAGRRREKRARRDAAPTTTPTRRQRSESSAAPRQSVRPPMGSARQGCRRRGPAVEHCAVRVGGRKGVRSVHGARGEGAPCSGERRAEDGMGWAAQAAAGCSVAGPPASGSSRSAVSLRREVGGRTASDGSAMAWGMRHAPTGVRQAAGRGPWQAVGLEGGGAVAVAGPARSSEMRPAGGRAARRRGLIAAALAIGRLTDRRWTTRPD